MRLVSILILAILLGACKSPRLESARTDGQGHQQSRKAKIIDVRTPQEFAAGHLPGAINLPVGQIDRQIQEAIPDRDQPLLLHCQTGKRSAVAKAKLDLLGYKEVRDLGSIDEARAVLNLPSN